MTTLKATFDPFVGTLTTTNLASYGSPQWLRIFWTILARKKKFGVQNFPNGPNSSWILILWLSRAFQGRWKRTSSPNANLEKLSAGKKPSCRTWAEACHNYVNLTHKGVSCHATLKNKLSANFNSGARGCWGRGQIAFDLLWFKRKISDCSQSIRTPAKFECYWNE